MIYRELIPIVTIGLMVGCGRDEVDFLVSRATNFLKTCDYASRISSDYRNLVADSLKITFLRLNHLQSVDRSNGFQWSGAFDVQYMIRSNRGAVLKKQEAAQVNVIGNYMVLNLRDSGDLNCRGMQVDKVPSEKFQ